MKNKITKKEARARREAYRLALAEGRVVRYGAAGVYTFTTFATIDEAEAFAAEARKVHPEVTRLTVPK